MPDSTALEGFLSTTMYVFGSANLSETFINDNLFDE